MPDTFSLDHLARHWREYPGPAAFAAVAEGLRKRGDHAGAAAVALEGLGEHPADVPGLLALARIRQDQGDPGGMERALQAAHAADPTHPVVRRALDACYALPESGREPSADESEELLYSDDEAAPALAEPLLSESLAILYHRQGHPERAHEVYTALLERDPENTGLRRRRDSIAAEAAGCRPRPYDAAVSGGRSLREWLAALAAVTLPSAGGGTAYDAFYHAPASSPPNELADFDAFQSWLKGLDR